MSRFDTGVWARARAYLGGTSSDQGERDERDPPAGSTSAVEIAAALCRRFEGFRAEPYLCPAGVPTIGYGATYYLNGTAVTLRDRPLSLEAADRLLVRQIETVYLPAALRQCPTLADEAPERLAAIVDWTFNLGEGRLRASTLRQRIETGDWNAVPAELRKWVRGGGRVLPGLVARREAEAALV